MSRIHEYKKKVEELERMIEALEEENSSLGVDFGVVTVEYSTMCFLHVVAPASSFLFHGL
ncbi:hypothetical protein BGZ97_010711 [Linnemannia gamsii]|uniref:Uncharacterized protein n=1 Tax=Linnemannia gamsii TaxID=64522 RepID=A0A9P6R541_9FUNG|nr:hypothetical protein BGZ97_010711 [Linnemannia gamsii]